jgi:hypothetical protein
MNSIARTFNQLLETLTHKPESHDVDIHLANLASGIGREGCTLVYLQTRPKPISALAALLEPFGIELTGDWKNHKRFIYARVKEREPSPFTGAIFHEHKSQEWQIAA